MVEGSAALLDRVYAALAHPVRRDILAVLSHAPARVTDVAQPFAISLAAVSKHIHVLEEADLVSRRVVGRDHFLTALPHGLDDAHRWILTYRSFWESRLEAGATDATG